MPVSELAGRTKISLGAPWRRRRFIVPVVAVLLVVGAFLFWGPIGLGNGPLSAQSTGGEGWADTGGSPAGFVVPIFNSGSSPAVVDSVDLVGGTRYPTPRLIAVEVLGQTICAGAWPARADGPGFNLAGCPSGHDQGPLIGRPIGPTQATPRGFAAAFVAAAPPAGTCWVISKIVLHYHVGFRRYAATDSFEMSVCGKGASAQVTAAMNAAMAAS